VDMKLCQLLINAKDAKNVMMRMLQHENEHVRESFRDICADEGCDVSDLVRAINRFPEGGE